MNSGGDVLARGGRSATFPASGKNISQARWDAIWAEYKPTKDVQKADASASTDSEK